jgi:hypothetical protein
MKGAKYFADFLKSNCTLEKLDLNGSIDVEGFKFIANALSTDNRTLKYLDVSRTVPHLDPSRISRIFSSDIANIMTSNNALEELEISSNFITSDDVGFIFSSLKCNSTLRMLTLSYNQIDDRVLPSLAECIKMNSSLESIQLDGDAIRDANYLAEAVDLSNSLTTIVISSRETEITTPLAALEIALIKSRKRRNSLINFNLFSYIHSKRFYVFDRLNFPENTGLSQNQNQKRKRSII